MSEESHTQSGMPQHDAPSSDVSSRPPPISGDGTNLSHDQTATQKAHRKIAPSAEESAFDFESTPTSAQTTKISHSQPTTSPPVVDSMPASLTTDDKADIAPVTKTTFEDIPSMSSGDSLASSSLNITLLCTTGARVSLALDQKFIATHSMPVKEPESITVGMLKSVIYTEWQSSQKKAEAQPELLLQKQDSQTAAPAHTPNWGAVLASSVTPGPVSPDHIRLIHLGKVLVDTFTLEEYKITSSNAFNVLHLSVRPESMGTKDKNSDGKQSRSKRRASAHAAEDRQNASNTRGGDRSSAAAGETPARESHARSGCCVIS